jgi:hypothetical protein
MATLTHHDNSLAAAEQLQVPDGTRKTFITIIGAGILILVLGLLAAIMGWGAEHHAAGAEAAGHLGASAGHGAGASVHHEGSPVWLKRLLVSIWHSNVFFIGVSVVGTVWMAIQYVAYAGWSVSVKRISEALSAWLLPGAIIMLITFFLGRHDIFHWTHEGIMEKGNANYDAIIAGKSGFLNLPFYLIRMVTYLGGSFLRSCASCQWLKT